MPTSKYTSWTHGSSMQVEYPNRVTSVRHTGPFVRIEGAAGQNTWVHLPVPTPTVADGTPMRVGAGLVSFRTKERATVHEVIIYDGDKRIAEHTDLRLQGDHLEARFEVPDNPKAGRGINITLGVSFSDHSPDARSMQIEIIGAGVEFFA